ncbi:MAG: thymidine kinase [Deltaproteobacteria bacterium]|nr:thymidine kinase [Deltaproteobacteria bacterium]
MQLTPSGVGWIEVICGSMFSGKSEELIRRLRRAQIARLRVQAFKAATDDRYDRVQIVSHNDQRLESVPVKSAAELYELIEPDTQVVGIDEVQFLDAGVVEVCEALADRGVRVIVAGLDQDYRGKPFEPVPTLMAVAEFVTKEHAICVKCGNPANRSQRVVRSDERVVVGAGNVYEPRCRRCFTGAPDERTGDDAPAGDRLAAEA